MNKTSSSTPSAFSVDGRSPSHTIQGTGDPHDHHHHHPPHQQQKHRRLQRQASLLIRVAPHGSRFEGKAHQSRSTDKPDDKPIEMTLEGSYSEDLKCGPLCGFQNVIASQCGGGSISDDPVIRHDASLMRSCDPRPGSHGEYTPNALRRSPLATLQLRGEGTMPANATCPNTSPAPKRKKPSHHGQLFSIMAEDDHVYIYEHVHQFSVPFNTLCRAKGTLSIECVHT